MTYSYYCSQILCAWENNVVFQLNFLSSVSIAEKTMHSYSSFEKLIIVRLFKGSCFFVFF